MSTRIEIKSAVVDILTASGLFMKILTEPSDIEKERSYPIVWIYLGDEMILDGAISTTCYMRNITLEITLGAKHLSSDDNMDELIDSVFDLMKSNFTLNGTAINLTPTSVRTDQGYLHPYALAAISFTVTTR